MIQLKNNALVEFLYYHLMLVNNFKTNLIFFFFLFSLTNFIYNKVRKLIAIGLMCDLFYYLAHSIKGNFESFK